MAIAFVTSGSNRQNIAGTGANPRTLTVTTSTFSTSAGDVIVIGWWTHVNTYNSLTSIKDANNNNLTVISGTTLLNGLTSCLAFLPSAAANATNSVTIVSSVFDNGNAFDFLYSYETFSGFGSATQDQNGTVTGSGGSLTTGSITTPFTNGITVMCHMSSDSGLTNFAGNNFFGAASTMPAGSIAGASGSQGIGMAYQIESATHTGTLQTTGGSGSQMSARWATISDGGTPGDVNPIESGPIGQCGVQQLSGAIGQEGVHMADRQYTRRFAKHGRLFVPVGIDLHAPLTQLPKAA